MIIFYWKILVVLLKTPFLHTELIWGIVPLYFGWFMNELTSDSKSFNTAIQTGFAFIWAGAQWSQLYLRKSGTVINHNGMLAVSFAVTILVLMIGVVAFISGIRKRFPRYCGFLGHSRFANYFMIMIFPMQAQYLRWSWDRLIAIAGFAIPLWILLHFLFKPLRR